MSPYSTHAQCRCDSMLMIDVFIDGEAVRGEGSVLSKSGVYWLCDAYKRDSCGTLDDILGDPRKSPWLETAVDKDGRRDLRAL